LEMVAQLQMLPCCEFQIRRVLGRKDERCTRACLPKLIYDQYACRVPIGAFAEQIGDMSRTFAIPLLQLLGRSC
jgi:hypothetical protein